MKRADVKTSEMTPQLSVTQRCLGATERECCPYLNQVVLGHRVGYPTNFVVGFEDVIVNLKFLSAIISAEQTKRG